MVVWVLFSFSSGDRRGVWADDAIICCVGFVV